MVFTEKEFVPKQTEFKKIATKNMTQQATVIALMTICSCLGACKKEAAIEVDESFKGNWKHYIDAANTITLEIDEDSKGIIWRYENGDFKSDTQYRKWLIKNDILHFGWLSAKEEKFSIDQYPTTASNAFIDNLDTIPIGGKYIILDGNYYVK
jgi:hypothetical protein